MYLLGDKITLNPQTAWPIFSQEIHFQKSLMVENGGKILKFLRYHLVVDLS